MWFIHYKNFSRIKWLIIIKPDNMNNRFYYVYLIAGTIALILLVYQLVTQHNAGINLYNLAGYVFAVVILYYLAFKTYHEKKDKEMM